MKITQERFKELVSYDPDTGHFTRRTKSGVRKWRKTGSVCVSGSGKGYVYICLDYKSYMAHRLVWLYVYGKFPEQEIDHISGDGTDNRLANLRSVSRLENRKNIRKFENNKSGITGVHFDKSIKRWVAYINVSRKRFNLGCYGHIFEAVCARKSAESEYCYHKNHGSSRPL